MRMIDADALIEQMDAEPEGGYYSPHDVISLLMTQPTVEPRCETCEAFNKTRLLIPQPERKTGKWTKGNDMPPMKYRNGKPKKFWPYFQYCSNCGHKAFDDSEWGEQLFDWCPYCGARMER